jgi:hypothetical protein
MLDVDALKQSLLALFADAESAAQGGGMSKEAYAQRMAQAITDQIRTAGVPAGTVIVSVAGQATGTPNPSEIQVA